MKPLEAKLERYKDQHPAFDGERSCKLVEACMKAFDDDDDEAFSGHVATFDRGTKLDNWTVTLLLIVKNIIRDGGGPAVELSSGGLPDEIIDLR
jgi:hypothetical protein